MIGTTHGTSDRVSYAIEVTDDTAPHPSTSTMLYGERKDEAIRDFAARAKAMHRGKTIRLARMVRTEAWVQHGEVLDALSKPVIS